MLTLRSATRRFTRLPAVVRGVLLMLLASAFFAGNAIIVRFLSVEIHAFQIAFMRNAFGLLSIAPWLFWAGPSALRIGRMKLHAVRSLLNLVSMLCYFWAVAGMPLADVTAIGFATPLFASLGAVILFKEVMRLRRWSALAIGFAGVLLVLRPGFAVVDQYTWAAIGASASLAGVLLIIKHVVRIDDPRAVVLINLMMIVPMSLPGALLVWKPPAMWMLALAALHGVLGTYGNLMLTHAFRLGDASVMAPIDFARLPFVAILAFLFFGEAADLFTWGGGAMIFASTMYIAQREAALKRSSARVVPTNPEGAPAPVAEATTDQRSRGDGSR